MAKRKSGREWAIIFGSAVGALLLVAVLFLFLFQFIGPLLALVLIGVGYGLWWLITSQNIEFEYSITNGDIDIDQIIAQRKRKRIVSVSGSKIESFGRYNAQEYAGRHFDRTVMAATAPNAETVWCFSYHSKKNGHTLVLFEPDDRVLNAARDCLPKLLQLELNRKIAH